MKYIKSLIFLLSCFCCAAFGATTVPVQLLNSTGSSSGQTIVSTGSSSAPGWGTLGLSGLSAISANTLVGNATGSSATPTAISVTGCNGAAQALQWTSGSGFGCNSSVATSGANTNITSLAAGTTLNTPNITGVTNGGNASAGSVGEYVTAQASSGAISLSSGVSQNIASISLTAGDWDVSGDIQFSPAGSTTISSIIAAVNTVSGNVGGFANATSLSLSFTTGVGQFIATPVLRVSVSSTTTVYLVANSTFGVSTMAAGGIIRARRVR